MKDPPDLHKAGLELSGAVLHACGQMEHLLRVTGGGILGYMIKLSCVASLMSLHGIAWTDSYRYCRKQTWKHFFLEAPNESY